MKQIILLAFVLLPCLYHSQTNTEINTAKKTEGAITITYGVPAIFKKLLETDLRETDMAMKSNAIRYGNTFRYASGGFGPLLIKWDQHVGKKIGLGVVIGYFNAWATETYKYTYTYFRTPEEFTQTTGRYATSFSIGGRFNYHFINDEKTDLYLGFGVGYTYAVIETRYSTTNPNYKVPASHAETQPVPLYLAATLGVRQYFSENIGFCFEVGFDKWSILQVGLAFKIK